MWQIGSLSKNSGFTHANFKILYVERNDGKLDNCGNPPPISPGVQTQSPPIKTDPERLKPPTRPQRPVPVVPPFPFPKEPYVPIIEPEKEKQPEIIPFVIPGVNPNPTKPLEPVPPEKTGDTSPTIPNENKIPAPTIIINPSADPGKLKITDPFSIPDAQPFTPNEETKAPEPAPKIEPTKPKVEPTPEKDPFEKFRDDVGKIIPLIPTIANNTNPDTVKAGTREIVCNSFAPGGCNASVNKNASDAANNSSNNGSKLDALNAGVVLNK